jgi:hypothetical membrane protein
MTIGQKLDPFFAKRRFEYFGIIGCAIIAITCIVTAIGFTGLTDEPYSMLNHFISELGMTNESQLAWVFNIGLLVGAPILGIFILGTRVVIPSRVGGIGRVVGIVTAVGGTLVGVFPANLGGEAGLMGHIISAMIFFVGGCVTVGIFSLAIVFQKERRASKWLSAVGAGVVLSFVIFLIAGGGSTSLINIAELMTMMSQPREDFMLLAFLEWLPLLGILAWMFLTALDSALRVKRNQHQAGA